jgi:UDP-N-acetylglucosamine acyltransferase
MIQGGTPLNKDVPPYTMAARIPACYVGLNTVGLRRHNFSAESIVNIQEMYRIIYMSGLNTTHAIERIEKEFAETPERNMVVDFIKNSDRGIIKGFMS